MLCVRLGCLPAPANQPFSSNSLGLSIPEEVYSRNGRASGTLKLGYGMKARVFKIITTGSISQLVPEGIINSVISVSVVVLVLW